MLNVTIQGSEEISLRLTSIVAALDTQGILDEAGALLIHRIRTRFLAEEDPDGGSWVPSAASMKRAGGGTLYHTGRLFHSIQLYKSGGVERAIGTNVPYASKHNFGTGGMLKRQFLGFGDEDATLVEDLIYLRISKALA